MITHIALFNLRENADGENKQANLEQIKKNVETLKNEIDTIIEIHLSTHNDYGFPFPHYEICVMATFKNAQDLGFYFDHPAHQRAKTFASSVAKDIAGITFGNDDYLV
jgi:hypothetical protein